MKQRPLAHSTGDLDDKLRPQQTSRKSGTPTVKNHPLTPKKNPSAMDYFIGGVINGRVFKRLADSACGKRFKNNELRTMVNTQTLQTLIPPPPTKPSPGLLGCSPSNQHEEHHNQNMNADADAKIDITMSDDRHIHQDETSLPSHNTGQVESLGSFSPKTLGVPESKTNQEDLPRAHYLEIFQFKDKYGRSGMAASLTERQLWQWNVIFRGERIIDECISSLEAMAEQLIEIESTISKMSHDLEVNQEPSLEIRDRRTRDLEAAVVLRGEAELEIKRLKAKLQHAREEISYPRADLFRDWKMVMSENNLLETTPEGVDDRILVPSNGKSHPDLEPSITKAPVPTASEVERIEEAAIIEELLELIREREYKLGLARQKVEGWANHYDNELREYRAWKDLGKIDTTKSEFDITLLKEEREAMGDWTKAEQVLEQVKELAREFGIAPNDIDQESNFADHVNDGYRESMEAALVGHVDRGWIQDWLHEENDRHGHSTACDEWESKSIDLGDSVRVVAEGKERKRIDRWRSMCELLEVEARSKLETCNEV